MVSYEDLIRMIDQSFCGSESQRHEAILLFHKCEQEQPGEFSIGLLEMYMRIIDGEQLPASLVANRSDLATLCVTSAKNVIKSSWHIPVKSDGLKLPSGEKGILPAEKARIRALLETLFPVMTRVLDFKHILEAVIKVARYDFPAEWPGLQALVDEGFSQYPHMADAASQHRTVEILTAIINEICSRRLLGSRGNTYKVVGIFFPRLIHAREAAAAKNAWNDLALLDTSVLNMTEYLNVKEQTSTRLIAESFFSILLGSLMEELMSSGDPQQQEWLLAVLENLPRPLRMRSALVFTHGGTASNVADFAIAVFQHFASHLRVRTQSANTSDRYLLAVGHLFEAIMYDICQNENAESLVTDFSRCLAEGNSFGDRLLGSFLPLLQFSERDLVELAQGDDSLQWTYCPMLGIRETLLAVLVHLWRLDEESLERSVLSLLTNCIKELLYSNLQDHVAFASQLLEMEAVLAVFAIGLRQPIGEGEAISDADNKLPFVQLEQPAKLFQDAAVELFCEGLLPLCERLVVISESDSHIHPHVLSCMRLVEMRTILTLQAPGLRLSHDKSHFLTVRLVLGLLSGGSTPDAIRQICLRTIRKIMESYPDNPSWNEQLPNGRMLSEEVVDGIVRLMEPPCPWLLSSDSVFLAGCKCIAFLCKEEGANFSMKQMETLLSLGHRSFQGLPVRPPVVFAGLEQVFIHYQNMSSDTMSVILRLCETAVEPLLSGYGDDSTRMQLVESISNILVGIANAEKTAAHATLDAMLSSLPQLMHVSPQPLAPLLELSTATVNQLTVCLSRPPVPDDTPSLEIRSDWIALNLSRVVDLATAGLREENLDGVIGKSAANLLASVSFLIASESPETIVEAAQGKPPPALPFSPHLPTIQPGSSLSNFALRLLKPVYSALLQLVMRHAGGELPEKLPFADSSLPGRPSTPADMAASIPSADVVDLFLQAPPPLLALILSNATPEEEEMDGPTARTALWRVPWSDDIAAFLLLLLNSPQVSSDSHHAVAAVFLVSCLLRPLPDQTTGPAVEGVVAVLAALRSPLLCIERCDVGVRRRRNALRCILEAHPVVTDKSRSLLDRLMLLQAESFRNLQVYRLNSIDFSEAIAVNWTTDGVTRPRRSEAVSILTSAVRHCLRSSGYRTGRNLIAAIQKHFTEMLRNTLVEDIGT